MEKEILEILKKFDIGKNGFLPNEPIKKLPMSIYSEWENLIDSLPSLNKEKKLRGKIETIGEFDINNLIEIWHYKRAYAILSMIASSYVFGDKPIMQSIPKKISIPLCYTSKYLGINPILTHAAVALYNWYLVDEKYPFTLDNLKSTNLMTGTEDEEIFYLTMVYIEKLGGNIILNLMRIRYVVVNKFEKIDRQQIIYDKLLNIKNNLDEMIIILKKIIEKCNPDIYYNIIRPFLNGWEKNDDINGMIYEGICDKTFHYYGASAAQSSLFQTLDAAFNIIHDDKYFEQIQLYMPKLHREFIHYVKHNINIRQIIDLNNTDINDMYDQCIHTLKMFRSCHMNLVHEYILKQIKINAVSSVNGTEATLLIKFLNQTTNDTVSSLKK